MSWFVGWFSGLWLSIFIHHFIDFISLIAEILTISFKIMFNAIIEYFVTLLCINLVGKVYNSPFYSRVGYWLQLETFVQNRLIILRVNQSCPE